MVTGIMMMMMMMVMVMVMMMMMMMTMMMMMMMMVMIDMISLVALIFPAETKQELMSKDRYTENAVRNELRVLLS